MNLQTSVGRATVKQVCKLFGVSREAYYAAKRPTGQLSLPLSARAGAAAPRSGRPGCVGAAELETGIRAVTDAQPAWGVRKVWATLRRAPYDLQVGLRRVWAVMKALGLTLPADGPREAEPRRGHVAVEEPNRMWATDMTTVATVEDGTVAIVPVIDCGCRSVLSLVVTKSQEAPAVLCAVEMALEAEFGKPQNVPYAFELRTDHGPQYTGSDCEALCNWWRVEHTYAPVGRPTGNAVAERLMRTLKEECIWLRDWRNAEELRVALAAWMRCYNEARPHQSLEWQTPSERRAERLEELEEAA